MNVMLNRWLLYQTLACRIWARSAFYQSGGAYGFRDQLQDVMALVYARPDLARAQILRASAHQFPEGDVQHWWHPPTGRAFAREFRMTCYGSHTSRSSTLGVTGDASILDEITPFLDMPPLCSKGKTSPIMQPQVSPQQATLYEHCLRAH
jgi:cyclic beta-1,2-glucan synthetase